MTFLQIWNNQNKHSIMKKVILVFALLVLCISCQPETLIEVNEPQVFAPTEMEILKNNFSMDGISGSLEEMKGSLKVEWKSYVQYEAENRLWYEFIINNTIESTLESGNVTHINYSLLATIEEEKALYRIARLESHNGEAQKSYFELSDRYFTGMAVLFDMDGDMSRVNYYEKGVSMYGLEEEATAVAGPLTEKVGCTQKIAAKTSCDGRSNCRPSNTGGQCGSGNSNGGGYRHMKIGTRYIDWYNDNNGDGRGQLNEYFTTSPGADIYGYVWVPSGGSAPAPQKSWSYKRFVENSDYGSISRPSVTPKRIYGNPPSCRSFRYKKTSSNWQQAAVKGIKFNVYLLKSYAPYIKYKYTVRLNQAVLFGAPLQPKLGAGLTNKTVAYASAIALNIAMKETAHKYANRSVSPSVVDAYFKERIRQNFQLAIPGGRANPNAMNYSVTPTNYVANTIGFGDCD